MSADHGQMLGDRAFPVPMKEYGHPTAIHSTALTKVPWLVHVNGPRKRIVAEPPRIETGPETDALADTVTERLQQLGYR